MLHCCPLLQKNSAESQNFCWGFIATYKNIRTKPSAAQPPNVPITCTTTKRWQKFRDSEEVCFSRVLQSKIIRGLSLGVPRWVPKVQGDAR
jgi:hypothetical protein